MTCKAMGKRPVPRQLYLLQKVTSTLSTRRRPRPATGVRGLGSLAAFIDVCRLREKLEPASSRSSMVALVSDFIKRLDVEGLRRQEMVFFHSVKPMLAERASDLPSALKELGERRSR